MRPGQGPEARPGLLRPFLPSPMLPAPPNPWGPRSLEQDTQKLEGEALWGSPKSPGGGNGVQSWITPWDISQVPSLPRATGAGWE